MDSCTRVGVGNRDSWGECQSELQVGGVERAWVSAFLPCSTFLSVIFVQLSVLFCVAAHLLSPTLVPFKPRHEPEFEDVWAGNYCTFAKEKSKGDIYVFGLNNYCQLGEFGWLNDVKLCGTTLMYEMQSNLTLEIIY
jgi:hypothetical protein